MTRNVIELQGVEFVNKGAELMLYAIVKQVRQNYPDAVFTMAVHKKVPAERLKAYGIYIKKNSGKIRLLPGFIRRKFGVVLDKEVGVVLDGSGFAFSDQWGYNVARRRLGAKIAKLRSQGKKVILLPQAFGPFTDPALQQEMRTIITQANLIFAREPQSYGYLKNLAATGNISQAPDFTNLLSGKVPAGFDSTNKQVAIVPNSRMIDKKGEAGKHYTDFLCTAVNEVVGLGLKPYFLIHEGDDDITIAKNVNGLLKKPLEIVIDQDPLVIKGIISTAYFIVCSRFHGVVSALSQGVPCITTSWSHKYEMLHQEYDYKEGLIDNIGDSEELVKKIKYLASPKTNKQVSEKLKQHAATQKERSKAMWQTVFNVIDARSPQ